MTPFDERPTATFKLEPEDFVVEELEAYPASGQGEHLFVRIEKRHWTTPFAAAAVARALGVDPRSASWAGLKDRVSVSTQTLSIPFPIARDPAPLLEALDAPGLRVLEARRHQNKLKPGHLEGNRFTVRLRDLGPGDAERVRARLERAASEGVPNAFGAQRFGRDGQNPERALAWLRGEARGPRDKRQARLVFSALQSMLFNDLLTRRLADGSWATVLPGEVAKRCDSGGLFDVPTIGPELEEARGRAARFEITATGPMFGATMRWPAAEARALEEEVLRARGLAQEAFVPFRPLGEGTRRPLRVAVEGLEIAPSEGGLTLRFTLPKGSYATTLLGLACRLVEPPRTDGGAPATPGESGPSDETLEEGLDGGSTSDG